MILLNDALSKYYPVKDPARQAIYQTMIDLVPSGSENDDVSGSMLGILDCFVLASTVNSRLYKVDITYNNTILEHATVVNMLHMFKAIAIQGAKHADEPVPQALPHRECVQNDESDNGIVLSNVMTRTGGLPQVTAVKSGWEVRGSPP